jgi:arginyl-tRNA synthetase
LNPFVDEIVSALATASGLTPEAVRPLLAVPPSEELGDYAFPCFTLAKERRQSPSALARELAARIPMSDRIQKVETAGPYVNFTLDRSRFVAHVLGEVLGRGERYGSRNQGRGRTVVIDYSSPNLAKPFSIAHLRSTAIGNAIYRLHQFLGWRCVGINHLGDWGTNWGQLLAAYRKWGELEKVKAAPLTELLALYTRFNEELETRPELQEEARNNLEKLEAGDPEMRALWEFFVREGYKEAERIYAILEVRFDLALGESFYADRTEPVIGRFQERGLAKESEGALIVDLEEWDMAPLMLRTSKGTSTYHSRDLAALIHRWENHRFDKMVYVTDVRQALHFQQLFKGLELLGLEWWSRCQHAPFGMLSFKGEKMATRRGNLVFLEDVLNQAVERTARIIEEKNPELRGKEEVARQVGIGAVVFADLDSRRTRNVVFDWDEVLNFDGQTGPYLQYTYARFCSILRKYGQPVDPAVDLGVLGEAAEMRVARHLEQLPAQLEQAASESEPSYIATYLLDLAAAANKFYNELPVLGNADPALSAARVALVEGVRTVLRTGLGLLGMKAPEEM